MPSVESCKQTLIEWWIRRKRFEKLLIGLILAMLCLLIFVSVLSSKSKVRIRETCGTPACLDEAVKLRQITLRQINPCEDFYEFSCGNFWTSKYVDTVSLGSLQIEHLFEAITEPTHFHEHKMVTAGKILYQACMNEAKIERDRLTTIKAVLKTLGGWPVLEGDNWNEGNFDWMNNVFKLRGMGYYYSIVLALTLLRDPQDNNKLIFTVSTADMHNYQYDFFDTNTTQVAIKMAHIFGANDTKTVNSDMKEVFQFIDQMKKIEFPNYYGYAHQLFTVEQYQHQVGTIDWLSYINQITKPVKKFSKHDAMFFPPPEKMAKWLDVIINTPKRVLANYMMWKIVSDTTDYMPCEIRVGLPSLKFSGTREYFCLGEVERRFLANPFGIIAARKHLSVEKKKKVEELLLSFKTELIYLLDKVDWMEAIDKKKTVNKVQTLKLRVGFPVEYHNDKVLDDMVVDWVEDKYQGTFMSLIAQAQRNYVSMEFQQLEIPVSESLYNKTYNETVRYRAEEHTLYVPYIVTNGIYFSRNRPSCLNYGALGSLIGYEMSKMVFSLKNEWTETTRKNFADKVECMERIMYDFLQKTDNINWKSSQNEFLTEKAAGEQLSNEAYETWIEKYGKELPIAATNYTPHQLFWISSATAWCHAYLPFNSGNIFYFSDPDFVKKVVDVSIGNSHHFTEHFNCGAESRMNLATKCKIF